MNEKHQSDLVCFDLCILFPPLKPFLILWFLKSVFSTPQVNCFFWLVWQKRHHVVFLWCCIYSQPGSICVSQHCLFYNFLMVYVNLLNYERHVWSTNELCINQFSSCLLIFKDILENSQLQTVDLQLKYCTLSSTLPRQNKLYADERYDMSKNQVGINHWLGN